MKNLLLLFILFSIFSCSDEATFNENEKVEKSHEFNNFIKVASNHLNRLDIYYSQYKGESKNSFFTNPSIETGNKYAKDLGYSNFDDYKATLIEIDIVTKELFETYPYLKIVDEKSKANTLNLIFKVLKKESMDALSSRKCEEECYWQGVADRAGCKEKYWHNLAKYGGGGLVSGGTIGFGAGSIVPAIGNLFGAVTGGLAGAWGGAVIADGIYDSCVTGANDAERKCKSGCRS